MQDAWRLSIKVRAVLQVRQDSVNQGFAGIEPFADILAGREPGIPKVGIIIIRGASNPVASSVACHYSGEENKGEISSAPTNFHDLLHVM
jgi:hypothetical protein